MTAPRSRRLKAAFLRLAAAILMAVSFSGLAAGGEASTTHRAGDLVVYRFACHDAEDMIAIAERGACFRNSGPIAARLEAWVAGPYPPDYGRDARGASGSVWRVTDQFGDTEYVWINDLGGRHAGRREMAL